MKKFGHWDKTSCSSDIPEKKTVTAFLGALSHLTGEILGVDNELILSLSNHFNKLFLAVYLR